MGNSRLLWFLIGAGTLYAVTHFVSLPKLGSITGKKK